MVDVPPGVTVDWYATQTSEIPLESGTTSYTPAEKVTAIYWAEARTIATGIPSADRTAVTLTVNPAVVVDAGADQTACANSPTVTLGGDVSGGATTGSWEGGTGTFAPDRNALNASYTLSAAEVAAGTVTLTLTSADPAGPCVAVSDTMTITTQECPGPTLEFKFTQTQIEFQWVGKFDLYSAAYLTNPPSAIDWTRLVTGKPQGTNYWTNAISEPQEYFRLAQ